MRKLKIGALAMISFVAFVGFRSSVDSKTETVVRIEQPDVVKSCKTDSDCPLYYVCANGRCYGN